MFTVIKTRKEDEGEKDEEEAPNRKPKPKQVGKRMRMVRLEISTPGAMAPMVRVEEEEDKACVLMLLYMCPYSLIHVSLCFYPCVLNPDMHVSL